MFHQTPSRSLTLLSCENQPAFRISPLILYSVRTAQYGPQQRTSQVHQLVFVWCEGSSVVVGPGGAAMVDVFKHSAVALCAVANH